METKKNYNSQWFKYLWFYLLTVDHQGALFIIMSQGPRGERATPSQMCKLPFQSQSLTRQLNVLDLNWAVFLLLTLIGQEEPHGPTQSQIVPGR